LECEFKNTLTQLRDAIKRDVTAEGTEIDMLQWLSRASLEFMGQAGIGHRFFALDPEVDDEYGSAMKNLL
jgi:hypothetical protein